MAALVTGLLAGALSTAQAAVAGGTAAPSEPVPAPIMQSRPGAAASGGAGLHDRLREGAGTRVLRAAAAPGTSTERRQPALTAGGPAPRSAGSDLLGVLTTAPAVAPPVLLLERPGPSTAARVRALPSGPSGRSPPAAVPAQP